MKVYALENCSTCRKALAYLKSTGRDHTVVPIREKPPTKAELRTMLTTYEGKLAKLFNTAGRDYRALKLGARLPRMSKDEALDLLAGNGNLLKRPFVLVGNTGMVGFKLEEWLDKGIRPLPRA